MLVGLDRHSQAGTFSALHEMLEAQVKRTPEAVAVVAEGTSFTYAQLDARADQVASRLQERGIGPTDVVAIALERSFDLVAGLLAILKTGAAYLPLDPSYPVDRIAFMLEDADPVCVLACAATERSLPGSVDRVLIDTVLPLQLSAQRVRPVVDDGDAAYVIYTSGSTGRPKGVIVTHGAIANRLRWMQAEYGLGAHDRVLQKTPVGFDVSVWEFFWPLSVGAVLVMARPEGHREPEYLADLIAEEKITTVHFVPSMLRVFLDTEVAARCPSLHTVICSGEALPVELGRRFRQRFDAGLHNLYGPTEAAVDVTYWRCEPEPGAVCVPIGWPVWNTRVDVLDARLRPLPPGEVGEIYLAGVQLARGYLGRPGLTAEKFVADPLGAPGARLYRTGDLGRRRPDGAIEFVGRRDGQVKIRGVRIELAEIEVVLAQHPCVTQAVVTVVKAPSGEQQLIAYVTAAADQPVTPEHLRDHVAQYLPAAMVPTSFLVLPDFPLTANGKLDRDALPPPQFGSAGGGRRPADEREELVLALVVEVLGLPGASLDDGFVGLGGDSISAIRFVSRARQAGLRLRTADVLRHRTLAALSDVAADLPDQASVEPVPGVGPLPLTPIMHWLRERGGPVEGFSQSMVLRVPAGATAAQVQTCLQAVLDAHDMLRLQLPDSLSCEAPQPVTLPPGAVAAASCLEIVSAVGIGEGELTELVRAGLERSRSRLSLTAPTPLRATWFDRGASEPGRLALLIHHLAVDGVSLRILQADLDTAWTTLKDTGTAHLPPVPTSFRHWAQLLTEEATADRRRAELPHWTGVQGGAGTRLGRRALDPAADLRSASRSRTFHLTPELTEQLLTRGPTTLRTDVNAVLLAGLALAVGTRRCRGSRRINAELLVAMEGHGREDILPGLDLSRTVGWFTTLFPVRVRLVGIDAVDVGRAGAAVGSAVQQVREQLHAVPEKGFGYGLLRYLNPDTAVQLSGSAEADIGFNYLGRFPEESSADWGLDPAHDVAMDESDDDMPLAHAVEVNAVCRQRESGSVLSATWTWADAVLDEAEVVDLAELWFSMLARIAEHSKQVEVAALTSPDHSLLALSQTEIEDIESELQSF